MIRKKGSGMPDMNLEKSIEIEKMSKWFGDFQVLDNINLSVREGEKIVVCGPSGSENRP